MKNKTIDKKTGIATIIIVLISVICILAIFIPKSKPHSATLYAVIDVKGNIEREIDILNAEDEEFEVFLDDGHKVRFKIENHKIRFMESDCPDKICVNTGWLQSENDVAACIPNGVTLYLTVK